MKRECAYQADVPRQALASERMLTMTVDLAIGRRRFVGFLPTDDASWRSSFLDPPSFSSARYSRAAVRPGARTRVPDICAIDHSLRENLLLTSATQIGFGIIRKNAFRVFGTSKRDAVAVA